MKYKLEGLHSSRDANDSAPEKFANYKRISKFLSDTTDFLKCEFNDLSIHFLREKRSLTFETPNRVRVCHEYDVFQESVVSIAKDTPYFFINPYSRLDWLQIFCDGERITVARADRIKEIVISRLSSEIEDYSIKNNLKVADVIDEIWDKKQGLPCFIIFSEKPKQSFMIEMQFYETVQESEKENSSSFLIQVFAPIEPRYISYSYNPLSNRTSWLYIKSPKNFQITLQDKAKGPEKSNDPEVISHHFTDPNTHEMNIKIRIATSLRIWYYSIYYIAFAVIILLTCFVFNIFGVDILGISAVFECDGIQNIIQKESLITIVALVSAAIITTRSFMITEETILKRFSQSISIMLGIMVGLALLMLFIHQ